MAELVVLAYPDEPTAQLVHAKVAELQRDRLIDGMSATVARSTDGRITVTTPTGPVGPMGAGAASGALLGGLIGLLFFMPIGGLIVGGVLGALVGRAAEMGIDDEFRSRVQDGVKPGMSAVVIVFHHQPPDRALAALAPYGGRLLRTTLTQAAEAEIEQAMALAG